MKKQILSLNDTMKFGKHKDETIQNIIDGDSGYLNWMIENVDNIAFDEEVIEKLNLTDKLYKINQSKLDSFRKEFEEENDIASSNDYDYDDYRDNYFSIDDCYDWQGNFDVERYEDALMDGECVEGDW